MPRSAEKFDEIREKSKRQIMETALELFAKNGFHKTSIAMIAQKAGISTGLMYNYYGSKTALLEAILLAGFAEIEGMFVESEAEASPYQKMESMIEAYFASITEKAELWKLFLTLLLQPDVMETIHGSFMEFFGGMMRLIEEHFQQTGAADPVVEAKILGAILDGIGFHYLLDPDNYPVESVKNALIEKYCRPQLGQ
ncbi:MAG: TetR/AcrR family transcriptional regulator [bacterium]